MPCLSLPVDMNQDKVDEAPNAVLLSAQTTFRAKLYTKDQADYLGLAESEADEGRQGRLTERPQPVPCPAGAKTEP